MFSMFPGNNEGFNKVKAGFDIAGEKIKWAFETGIRKFKTEFTE